MAEDAARTVSPEVIEALLDGDQEFLVPARLLSGLTEEQAMAIPSGSPYSLAQVVAHLQFWQARQLARVRGAHLPEVEDLEATFAPPPKGTWAQLVEDVLTGIERAKELARERARQPSTISDDATIGYALASSALHNSYHWGQVALLRQMQGFWPPAGDDSG